MEDLFKRSQSNPFFGKMKPITDTVAELDQTPLRLLVQLLACRRTAHTKKWPFDKTNPIAQDDAGEEPARQERVSCGLSEYPGVLHTVLTDPALGHRPVAAPGDGGNGTADVRR